jgi:hypothetical protein
MKHVLDLRYIHLRNIDFISCEFLMEARGSDEYNFLTDNSCTLQVYDN